MDPPSVTMATSHTGPSTGPELHMRGNSSPGSEHGKMKRCKVVGCSADLQRAYCLKKNICPDHLKADAIRCEGMGDVLWRFCQQCGKLELLKNFEGNKRSCRASLHRRRLLSSDKQENGNRRRPQQQHKLALAGAGAEAGNFDSSCCFSTRPSRCTNKEMAAATAWCGFKKEHQGTWTEQQLSRSSSTLSGAWPAAGSAGAGSAGVGVLTVQTPEVAGDIWAAAAAAEAGNAYGHSMPALPAAAAALPPHGSSLFERNISSITCSSSMDGCEEAALDLMLEIEGELLAAQILAIHSSAGPQQQHAGGCCGQAAARTLHQLLPGGAAAAAVNRAQPKLLPTSSWCPAAAHHYPWATADVAPSPQLINSCAAPAESTTAVTGFSAAGVPGAAEPPVLHTAGPLGVDKHNSASNPRLRALMARFGQLQLAMEQLKQLRNTEAALRAELAEVTAAAASSATTCHHAFVDWL